MDNPSVIKDAYVTFQVDYTKVNNLIQNKNHGNQFSNYGYVGKFTSVRVLNWDERGNFVTLNPDGSPNDSVFNQNLSNWQTVQYNYESSDINPILSNYVSNYYDIFENDPVGHLDNLLNVSTNTLINGIAPGDVYGLYSSMGTQSNTYDKTDNSQFRVSAQGSASIGNHAIKLGFEYEQRSDSRYIINPRGLWTLGRGLVNSHIEQRDFTVGTYDSTLFASTGGGQSFLDPLYDYTFQQFYDGDNQYTFDSRIRESLGLATDGLDWVDFDSYGPELWTVDMFTPDNLLIDGGSQYVNYYGFDHAGEKLSGNPSLDDFFNKIDDNGDHTRENPAFRPIYVAGFIQDKFAFDDLIFNIGVRIDRFDANQSVLKDKYSLFPTKTVGEIDGLETPSNIGSDFVVYVSDAANPNANDVVGFRDGDTFYNLDGEEISDPSILHSTGVPNPWLVNPGQNNAFTDLNGESFKDYEPQVNISPRIAFSFPISDEALFFAHYDVLTQRPENRNRLDLIGYLLFDNGGSTINNPDLRAEQTIDYELGFQQKLDNYSALKISAFYREFRDQVQITKVIGAYPGNYTSFDNEDFGTVKGLTVGYDLRTRGNLSMRASYTLQFADGTGSSTTTSQNLVSGGAGNLRTLIPLNFDQRHRILLSMDYRYSSGKNYTGPVMFGKNILQNTGLNIVMRSGSGTPYTKRSRVNGQDVLATTEGNSPQEGQLNASRLPFSTTFDAKLDKTFDLKWGKGEEDGDKKEASLNVYIQTLNLLNAKNIIGVYGSTGNPEDDGFLAASYQQAFIQNKISEESFRDLYTSKVNDGTNYALPRRIRLGIQLNF